MAGKPVKRNTNIKRIPLKVKAEMRRLWESGVSSLELAEKFKVRDGTVRTYASRDGWDRAAHEKARAESKPNPALPARLEQSPNNELELVERVLRAGGSVTMASKIAGLPQSTLDNWLKTKPELAKKAGFWRAQAALDAMEALNKHAQADWRAGAHILAHHPDTKEDWTPNLQGVKGGINVIINFNRDEDERPAVVIEGTPEPG